MSCRTLPWCLHFSPFVGGREGVCCRPHCRADKDAPKAPRRPQERAAPQQQQQARHPHHQRARVEGHGQWQGGGDRDRRGGQRQGRGGEEGRDLQFLRWDASGDGVFLPLGGLMLSRFGSCKVLVTSLSWLVTDTVRNPGAELCGCDSSALFWPTPSPRLWCWSVWVTCKLTIRFIFTLWVSFLFPAFTRAWWNSHHSAESSWRPVGSVG